MTVAIVQLQDQDFIIVADGAAAAFGAVAQAVAAADRAEAAAETAETAREAVMAAGLADGVFEDTASGIAGTTSGEYFWVGDGAGFALYENAAGSPVTVATLVSGRPLASIPQAEAGTDNDTSMSPLTTAAAIDAQVFAPLASSSGAGLVGYTQGGAGSVTRTIQDKLRDNTNVNDKGAVGDGATDNNAAIVAALADNTVATVPHGVYATTAGFYDYLNSRFQGDGVLSIGGKSQARDRAFITNEVGGIDDSNSYQNFFDGDWSKQFEVQYRYVGPAVGSNAITTYRHLTRAAARVRVSTMAGGVNTEPDAEHLGRTGLWEEFNYLTHGGQGDYGLSFLRLGCYSTRNGTHWLAEPAMSRQAMDFDTLPTANGWYQQRDEVNHSDYNVGGVEVGVNVHTDTLNYNRNSNVTTKYQGWWSFRVQSRGTYPVDGFLSLAGPWKRVIDTCATDLGSDGATLAQKANQFIYLDVAAAPDPRGISRLSTLTNTRFGYDSTAGAVITKLATGKKSGIQNDSGTFLADPTAWITATLSNSWVAYTTQGQSAPKYRRDMAGQVVLKGQASGGAASTAIFALPVGFRPPERMHFRTFGVFGAVELTIDAAGAVFILLPADSGGVKYVSLDGITFDTLA